MTEKERAVMEAAWAWRCSAAVIFGALTPEEVALVAAVDDLDVEANVAAGGEAP